MPQIAKFRLCQESEAVKAPCMPEVGKRISTYHMEERIQIVRADAPDLDERISGIKKRMKSQYGTSHGVIFLKSNIPEPRPPLREISI